jgi:outer membrane protein TolC
LALLLASTASISEAARGLTLEAALTTARVNDAGLAAAQRERGAARAATRSVWASWLPVVDVRQLLTHLDDATVSRANLLADALAPYDTLTPPPELEVPKVDLDEFRLYQDERRTEIAASWALWTGGARRAALGAAHAGEALAAEAQELRLRQVELLTKLAFLRARQAVRQVDVAQADRRRLDAYVRVSQERRAVGKATDLDCLRWRVAAERAKATLAAANAALAAARADLARALGRPQHSAALELEPIVDARDLPEVPLVEQLWRMAAVDSTRSPSRSGAIPRCTSADRSGAGFAAEATVAGLLPDAASPDLPVAILRQWQAALRKAAPSVRAAAASAELAAAAVGGATAELLPSVALVGSLAWQPNSTLALDGYREWNASLVLSVPLLPLAGAWFERAQAKAAAEAQRWRLVDAERQAERDLLVRVAQVAAALQQRRHALQARRLATAALGAAERGFRAGVVTRLELEDARVALYQAELAAIGGRMGVRNEAALLRFLLGDDALFAAASASSELLP